MLINKTHKSFIETVLKNHSELISLWRRLGPMTGSVLGKMAQQVTGNDHALDLRSSLVDLEDLCVTHQLLHWIVAVETGTAKDLKRRNCALSNCDSHLTCIRSRLICSVSGEAFRNRRIVRGRTDERSRLDCGSVGVESSKLEVDCHVGEHELNGLVLK